MAAACSGEAPDSEPPGRGEPDPADAAGAPGPDRPRAREPDGPDGAALTGAAIRNAAYTSGLAGDTVVLDGGARRAPVSPGSAVLLIVRLERSVTGDLDGDGREDAAVVLSEIAGGPGLHWSLHALRNADGTPVEVGWFRVGEGIELQRLALEEGEIVLHWLRRLPGRPRAEPPTLPRTARFRVEAGELRVVEAPHLPGETPLEEATRLEAFGNEPFWNLRVAADGAEFREPGGDTLRFPAPIVEDPEPGVRRWRARSRGSPGQRVELEVRSRPCPDTMADRIHPFEATLRLDDRELTGCARPAAEEPPRS